MRHDATAISTRRLEYRWIPVVIFALLYCQACAEGRDSRNLEIFRPLKGMQAIHLYIDTAGTEVSGGAFNKDQVPLTKLMYRQYVAKKLEGRLSVKTVDAPEEPTSGMYLKATLTKMDAPSNAAVMSRQMTKGSDLGAITGMAGMIGGFGEAEVKMRFELVEAKSTPVFSEEFAFSGVPEMNPTMITDLLCDKASVKSGGACISPLELVNVNALAAKTGAKFGGQLVLGETEYKQGAEILNNTGTGCLDKVLEDFIAWFNNGKRDVGGAATTAVAGATAPAGAAAQAGPGNAGVIGAASPLAESSGASDQGASGTTGTAAPAAAAAGETSQSPAFKTIAGNLGAGLNFGLGGATSMHDRMDGAFSLALQPEVQYFPIDRLGVYFRFLWEREFYKLTYGPFEKDYATDVFPLLWGARYYITVADKLQAFGGGGFGVSFVKPDVSGAKTRNRFSMDMQGGVQYDLNDKIAANGTFDIFLPNLAPQKTGEKTIARFAVFMGLTYYLPVGKI